MANQEKLLEKAKNSPNNLRFTELCALAESYGWEFDRQKGSHRMYKNPFFGSAIEYRMNFQDDNGKAKSLQVRQLLNAIEIIEGAEEDA